MQKSKNVINRAYKKFLQEAFEVPLLEAQLLVAHVLSCDRLSLLVSPEKELSGNEIACFESLLKRRLAKEPMAYLRGQKEFYGRDFYVDKRVLIPRPDTEIIVQKALSLLPKSSAGMAPKIVDVCTGSGCIAITLALERSDTQLVAVDISEDALQVARQNSTRYGLAEGLDLRQGHLLEPCFDLRELDLVVANPPYILPEEMAVLMQDVRDFEPHIALEGKGAHGLWHHEEILKMARPLLRKGAYVVFEMGASQASHMRQITHEGYGVPEIFQDLAGQDRGAVFQKRV